MSQVPGFRSNITWKKILSILLYLFVLLSYLIFILETNGMKEKILWTISLTLLYAPIFMMVTYFLGIRNRLFSIDSSNEKGKTPKIFLSLFFGIILGVILFFIPHIFSEANSSASLQTTDSNQAMTTEQIAAKKVSVILVEVSDGTGSGVITHKNGYAITNEHVVKGHEKCSVYFENDQGNWGEKIDANVIFTDERRDLAIIKLDTGNDYQIISFAEPDSIRDGQQVIAIGSPEGLINTISEGIISGIRNVDGVTYLQTSAPLTHGSSGGALLNRKGKLVGITSSGIEASGNLNFAISLHDIISFIKMAQDDGVININI